LKIIVKTKGGPHSGNFDHAGIPGHQGGSAPTISTVYHGTTREVAKYMQENGLASNTSRQGISSQANEVFTFVSPSKTSATFYAKGNTRNADPVVVKMQVQGKLYEVQKRMADYEAFGNFARKHGIIDEKTGIYDYTVIAAKLRELGYSGISFKDANAGGRIAYAVLPEFLTLSKE